MVASDISHPSRPRRLRAIQGPCLLAVACGLVQAWVPGLPGWAAVEKPLSGVLRRSVVLGPLGLLLPQGSAWAVTNSPKEQIALASRILHRLADGWKDIEKLGTTAGADAALQALAGSSPTPVTVEVPTGFSPGISTKDRSVVAVTKAGSGFELGDFVVSVNGQEVQGQSSMMKMVEAAASQGKPSVFIINRLLETPFVTLERAANDIYRSAPSELPLPEPETLTEQYRDLQSLTQLATKDIIDLPTVKSKLDAFTVSVDVFLAA